MATKLRNIRVEADQWARWQAAAEKALTSISEFVRDAVEEKIAAEAGNPKPALRTKTGRVMADSEVEALADEAERGYDVGDLGKREVTPRFKKG